MYILTFFTPEILRKIKVEYNIETAEQCSTKVLYPLRIHKKCQNFGNHRDSCSRPTYGKCCVGDSDHTDEECNYK